MLGAGSDAAAALELSASRAQAQAKVDAWYAEWDELEAMLAELDAALPS